MRTATLRGRDADGGALGFDVDGVCTCDERDHSKGGGRVSCTPPSSPLRAGGCDDDGGVDDAIGYVFDALANLPGFGAADDTINTQIACGRQTILYVLQNYNGQANDPDVVVSAIQSVGIHTPHDGGAEVDGSACLVDEAAIDAGAAYPAKLDGTDIWAPAERLPTELLTGWVKDFRLVFDGRPSVTPGGKVLPLIVGSRIVTIGTPIMVARLVPLDEGGNVLPVDGTGKIQSADGKARSFRIEDGMITGRASASDILAAVGTILYCGIKKVVCSAADSMKLPTLDFKGEPCDALSIVLQFDAVRALLGHARPLEAPPEAGCAPTWQDQCDGGRAVCP
jgi:hypothetical protein